MQCSSVKATVLPLNVSKHREIVGETRVARQNGLSWSAASGLESPVIGTEAPGSGVGRR
jgi:hypothetical protein